MKLYKAHLSTTYEEPSPIYKKLSWRHLNNTLLGIWFINYLVFRFEMRIKLREEDVITVIFHDPDPLVVLATFVKWKTGNKISIFNHNTCKLNKQNRRLYSSAVCLSCFGKGVDGVI